MCSFLIIAICNKNVSLGYLWTWSWVCYAAKTSLGHEEWNVRSKMWHACNIINIQPKVSRWSSEEAQKATLDTVNFNAKYKLSYNSTTIKTWELSAGAGSLIYVLKPFRESTPQTLNLFLLHFPCQTMPVLSVVFFCFVCFLFCFVSRNISRFILSCLVLY